MTDTNTGTVVLNGERRALSEEKPLAAFLTSVDIAVDARGIAVALNEHVIRREDWSDVRVRPGDRIEVVTAKQGG